MILVYDKLWNLLKRRGITKKELAQLVQINPSTITRLVHNKYVGSYVLIGICLVLQCELQDICELEKL